MMAGRDQLGEFAPEFAHFNDEYVKADNDDDYRMSCGM